MKNIEIKIIGGFFAVIITVIVIAFWKQPEGASREKVITSIVSDSLNELWTNKLRAHEDSLQRAYEVRDSAWSTAYQNEKKKAIKAENKASAYNVKYNELKGKYAEPCEEIITACDKREQERISQIQAQETALIISDNRLTDCKANAESLNRELALADKSLKSKNQTITTLKDRLTTITNRSDRNFIFRNWKWVTGGWREFVLEK